MSRKHRGKRRTNWSQGAELNKVQRQLPRRLAEIVGRLDDPAQQAMVMRELGTQMNVSPKRLEEMVAKVRARGTPAQPPPPGDRASQQLGSMLRDSLRSSERTHDQLTRSTQELQGKLDDHQVTLGMLDQRLLTRTDAVRPRMSFNAARAAAGRHVDFLVCDICGSKAVLYRYPVEPWDDQLVASVHQDFPSIRRRDEATWCTCGRCALLIEANKLDKLLDITRAALERSFAQDDPATEVDPLARTELREAVELRLRDFFAHRVGERQATQARADEAEELVRMVRATSSDARQVTAPDGTPAREIKISRAAKGELDRQRLPGENDSAVIARALKDCGHTSLPVLSASGKYAMLIEDDALADDSSTWSKTVAELRRHPGHLAIVCDFCGSTEPVWRYPVKPWRDSLTDVVFPRPTIKIREQDTSTRRDPLAWYACEDCGERVEGGAAAVLVTRSLASSRKAYGDPGVGEMDVVRATAERISEFFAHRDGPRERWTLGGGLFRETIAPDLQPPEVRPQELPSLPDVGPYSEALLCQLKLRDFWKSPKAMDVLISARTDGGYRKPPVDVLTAFRNNSAAVLDRALTYYVSPQIADFLIESASGVPDTAVFASEDLPAQCGFLYLVHPMDTPCTNPAGHEDFPGQRNDVEPGTAMHSPAFHRVRAIAWDFSPPANLALDYVSLDERAAHGAYPDTDAICNLWLYTDSVSGSPTFRDHLTWPEGGRVDQPMRKWVSHQGFVDLDTPISGARLIIDPVRRLLVAAWSFISQEVAAQAERPANGLTRKQLERTGQRRDVYRPIRIVYLRREDQAAKSSARAAGTDREYHCLWWRRPHKRMVPYGPRSMEERPTRLRWIKGTICGPADRSKWDGLELKPTRAIYAMVK